MKTFREFLTEMSIKDSVELLDLKPGYSQADLKLAYKRASSKAHPDHGGSTTDQQKINAAYKTLKNSPSEPVNLFKNWREREEKEKQDTKIRRDEFLRTINPDAYTNYFETVFPGEKYKTTIDSQGISDVKIVSQLVGGEGLTKSFTLFFSVAMDVGRGLASPEGTFRIIASGEAYADGRKMVFRDIRWKQDSSGSVNKPENFFPKAKINKDRSKLAFGKKDAILTLEVEIQRIAGVKLQLSSDGKTLLYRFPGTHSSLQLTRFSMRTLSKDKQTATWDINFFDGTRGYNHISRSEEFEVITKLAKELGVALKPNDPAKFGEWFKKQDKYLK